MGVGTPRGGMEILQGGLQTKGLGIKKWEMGKPQVSSQPNSTNWLVTVITAMV